MDKVPVTARVRRRNLTAIAVSAGLVVFSCICVVTLIAMFSGHGHKAAAAPKHPASHTPHHATTTTRPAPATTTSSSSTTTRPSTTTTTRPPATTTTTTVAPVIIPPVTAPPPPPSTTTTTTLPVTATSSVSNSPRFCTVTVRLSTGAHATYALDAYVTNPGDTYVFDATVGSYSVEVSAHVTGTSDSPQCAITLGRPAPL